MTALRSAVYQALFYGCTLVLALIYLPLLALPRRIMVAAGELWMRLMLWLLARIVGLDYRVEGAENVPDGPAIYAAKHQSAWDTLALPLIIRDPAVVIKRELLQIPFYGWYARKHGMIGIDRGRGHQALRRMLREGERAVARGKPILVFPEGTRTAPGARQPYHGGVGLLYRELDLPVVPVALNSGLFWPRRSFLRRPGRITVRFLPAIPPGLERAAFMRRLEDAIESATDALIDAGDAGDTAAA